MDPELEVMGRHAMLFDDDATASFVNSNDALVEWNSLFIDRYDVRHLITNPPISFRKLHHGSSPPDSHLESEIDLERYADLPSASDEPEIENEMEVKDASGYRCVPFLYGNPADTSEQKNSDVGLETSAFHPPFPVPENLLQNLPPTEKVHQIIARTAMFVGEHGGQCEIVLRVKQRDNQTFGFLMPHHHLHPYFRYLVDHVELLTADNDTKLQEEKAHDNQTGGALSMLGSIYGSGEDEDEDGAAEADGEAKQIDSGEASAAVDISQSHQIENTVASGNATQKDGIVSKISSKVKTAALSKHCMNSIKPRQASGMKKDGDILFSGGPSIGKSKASSLFPISKVDASFVDPPSEVKRLVDRIVEIILKNGKDFEAVLIEQDKKHGKFPFLLPSNQYHPYYLKALKKAQESRLSDKSFGSEKDGSSWQETDKKTASVKESDFSTLGPKAHDLLLDYDRKEKFKMVLSKSKKDSQDQHSKETQQQSGVNVDAAAAAAILQAATRGIKNPSFDILSKTSLNGPNHGSSYESGKASSHGSLQSSQPQCSALKLSENRKPSAQVPVAKEIAKTAALAASEADSSEARLTREQQLKAERLRRAKMFAAMIKSGAMPLGQEPLRGSSVEPLGSGGSGSAAGVVNEEAKEREGSSRPTESGPSDKIEKSGRNSSDDENERKLQKRRHYRSRKHGESEGGEEEDEGKREEDDEKRSRKKHRSHHSSRHRRDRSKDRHKRRRRHSSLKSKESRHHHKHESSSEEEGEDDDRHHRHKHDSSSEDEHKHHKRRHRHDSSSEDDRRHRKSKHKRSRKEEERREGRSRKRRSHTDEAELEEGEIRTKTSDQSPSTIGDDDGSREASVDISKSSYQDKRTPSLPPPENTGS